MYLLCLCGAIYVAFFSRFLYNDPMLRIWAKVFTQDHIEKQTVYERNESLTYSHFFTYLSEICAALDIPTPVLLKSHIMNFAKFRHVVFLPRDFLESTEFDKLILENIL